MLKISLLIMIVGLLCSVLVVTNAYLPPRPTRPEKFTDKKEVKEYVEKLREYYAIIARGRYGKRSEYSAPDFAIRPYYYAVPLPYVLKYGSYMDIGRQYE